MFSGIVQFARCCRACGLDFEQFNVGDGPAAFLTLIIGGIIVALAIWVDIAFAPPFWLHVLLWTPLTIGSVSGGLRLAKALLLTNEYRHSAGERRVDGRDQS